MKRWTCPQSSIHNPQSFPNTTQTNLHLIIGLGQTGLSCVRYCLRHSLPFAVTDSRIDPPGASQLKQLSSNATTVFGEISQALIQQANQLIISPGISLKTPAIADAIQAGKSCCGDIELFVQNINQPIIAVTGSNAKSTVVALLGEMAKAAGIHARVAGNIGQPVLDLLTEPKADLYILELSSFQLETTHSLRAKVACVLNVSEDHLDRYDSMDAYRQAKMRIYRGCDRAVINRRDVKICPDGVDKQISFGLNAPAKDQFGIVGHHLMFGHKKLMDIDSLKLKGVHNIENALAALSIGYSVGLPMEKMLQTLKTFNGLPHRCQFVRSINQIDFYNDSKGTNVGATIAAIEGLGRAQKNIILIAGGVSKDADFTPLKMPIKKYVKTVVLIGEAASELKTLLETVTDVQLADSLEQAVILAYQSATKNDIVLLSPVCASFDMFKNFEDRGEQFMKHVNALM